MRSMFPTRTTPGKMGEIDKHSCVLIKEELLGGSSVGDSSDSNERKVRCGVDFSKVGATVSDRKNSSMGPILYHSKHRSKRANNV